MHLRTLLGLAFTLATAASAPDVSASSALEPVKLVPASGEGSFDREATAAAMGAIDVSSCKKKKGPTGDGHVVVTFAPTGSATDALADRPPYAGTKVGACVAKAFRKAKIPAFKGDPVSVGKNFHIE